MEKEDGSGRGKGDKLSYCIGDIPDRRKLFCWMNFLREAPYGQKGGRRWRVGSGRFVARVEVDKISSLDLLASCGSENGATTKAGHLEPPQSWMAEEEAFVGKVLSSQ